MPDPLDVLLPRERLGAHLTARDGSPGVRFEVWAPAAETVTLVLDDGTVPLVPSSHRGHWTAEVAGAGHGTRYRYSIDGSEPLPDPASAWQPDGVDGASAVVDSDGFGGAFAWTDETWRGLDLAGTVIYELHVGTFTPEGTFDAAATRLADLASLGIGAVELMPVNAFPGTRNWGYDGVFAGAVQHSYGGPAGLARFVDAAHRHGIGVILDVVFNHVGPEGNVLGRFGPYFTDEFRTPWGDAVNVARAGSDGVRRYFLEVVRRFVADHHVDGLRLDAVDSVPDPTANPFWEQVARVARSVAGPRRSVLVTAETSDNDPRFVRPPDRGLGLDAVWNDDLHHCLRVAVTGERHSYYTDFEGSAAELADIVEHRWRFRGTYSEFRGRLHGRPADDVAPMRFVVCSHNHDQIGNRPLGDRPDVSSDRRRFMAGVVLLSPFTPLLFMGEEYDDPAPFPFFVDHSDPALLAAVREGRAATFAEADGSGDVPDPGDEDTFRRAVLDPSLAGREPNRSVRAMYAELIRLRREITTVASPEAHQQVHRSGEVVVVERTKGGERSAVVWNVSDTPSTFRLDDVAERTVVFDSSAAAWGGDGSGVALDAGSVHLGPWAVALLTG
jgi:maltooligosyltrehalose trehalohydrolase